MAQKTAFFFFFFSCSDVYSTKPSFEWLFFKLFLVGNFVSKHKSYAVQTPTPGIGWSSFNDVILSPHMFLHQNWFYRMHSFPTPLVSWVCLQLLSGGVLYALVTMGQYDKRITLESIQFKIRFKVKFTPLKWLVIVVNRNLQVSRQQILVRVRQQRKTILSKVTEQKTQN